MKLTSKLSLIITLLFILLAIMKNVQSAYCHGKPGAYYTNNQTIWKQNPRHLKSHKYGKLYEVGQASTTMKLLHVYGDMYQMGFAQGALLKDQLNIFIYELWDYVQKGIQDSLTKIPKFIRHSAANFAAGAALDITYEITKPFTNKKYFEEMKGLSDASGIPFHYFRRLSMIGQLTKGQCSMFGAWGKATSNGQTVQLRALDWDFDGPYRKYPLVTVYHPSDPKYGNKWANIGFMGWLGVLSGVNQHRLAISQIGVSFPDDTFGKQSRFGNPFTFVMRDVLQWDRTIEDSIQRMQKTKRTCNLILGVGDGRQGGYFRSFQYSHSVANVINDTHPLPHNDTFHLPLQNTVYHGMDWLCPSYYIRLHEMLEKYHGNITAQNTIRYILPGLNSGNLQAVVYDLSNEWVYISYGYIDEKNKKINAYNRPYIGLNLKQLFAESL